MPPAEYQAEDRTVRAFEPREPRFEAYPVRYPAPGGKSLEDALVLPEPLREQLGTLQKTPPGLDFREGDVVVIDRKDACEQKPTSKATLTRAPPVGQIDEPRRESHPQQRAKLQVDPRRAHRVTPDGSCLNRQG